MYVCLCRGVSDRAVLGAIRSGAGTVEEVGRLTGAGTVCAGCRSAIEALLRSAAAPAPGPAPPATRERGRGGRGGSEREPVES